jgi:hypothetical protein
MQLAGQLYAKPVIVIQSLVRVALAKKLASRKKAEAACAKRIQQIARGYIIRKLFRRRLETATKLRPHVTKIQVRCSRMLQAHSACSSAMRSTRVWIHRRRYERTEIEGALEA